jgi:hypothetical protein
MLKLRAIYIIFVKIFKNLFITLWVEDKFDYK